MDRPSLGRVIFGAALVLLTALTLLSLLSHAGNQYPSEESWPPSSAQDNWCGVVGSWISSGIIGAIGAPAAYLAVLLGILWVVLAFTGREIHTPALRIAGILLALVATSTVFAWYFQRDGYTVGWSGYPGYVGDFLSTFLVRYLSWAGSLLMLLTVGAVALFIATDMLAYDFFAWLVKKIPGWIAFGARAFFGRVASDPILVGEGAGDAKPARRSRKKAEPKDVDDPDVSDDDEKLDAPEEEDEEEVVEEKVVVEPKRAAVDFPEEEEKPEPALEPAAASLPTAAEAAGYDEKGDPKELPAIEEASGVANDENYLLPGIDLLDVKTEVDPTRHDHLIREKARVLERCLGEFGIAVRVVSIDTGPVVTLYELELAPGIKVGRIIGLSDDIAMALKAPNVRIVAPIPGKSTVGVEVPNLDKEFVRLREIMEQSEVTESRSAIPLYLGKDAAGAPLIVDMASLPHLLIAGETGSGKSVCINSIILSVLMTRTPGQVRLLLVDPKMVELSGFKDLPHLLSPVVTDMKKAATILEWAETKMDERYEFLSLANVRNIAGYNRLTEAELRERFGIEPNEEIDPKHLPTHMPYILIVIDELADLMMMAPKEIETSITRLAQKSRAVGIHIILATQRPSVDVVTGLIKSNLPARISFRVASKVDSRTILDQNGADKLLGSGDMLFLQPGTSKLIRAQGTYISDNEIQRVVDFAKGQSKPDFSKELVSIQEGGEPTKGSEDPLYDEAIRIVIESQRGSVSLLQRKLEIGYSRAARLVDFMAADGILGSYKGSQAREVMFTPEQWEERMAAKGEPSS